MLVLLSAVFIDDPPPHTMRNGTILFPKTDPNQGQGICRAPQWQALGQHDQQGPVRSFRPVQLAVPLLTVNWVPVSLPLFLTLFIFVKTVSISG